MSEEEGRLRSWGRAESYWPTKILKAVCLNAKKVQHEVWRGFAFEIDEDNSHEVPALDCRCGIWGVDSLDALSDAILIDPFFLRDEEIIGKIKAWGRVAIREHSWGFRAEHAEILSIMASHFNAVEVAKTYGVPVFFVNGPRTIVVPVPWEILLTAPTLEWHDTPWGAVPMQAWEEFDRNVKDLQDAGYNVFSWSITRHAMQLDGNAFEFNIEVEHPTQGEEVIHDYEEALRRLRGTLGGLRDGTGFSF
jgi:hypothetical protein